MKTILVCDDDPGMLELVRAVLESQVIDGKRVYDTVTALDGVAALRLLEVVEVDLALIDLSMPANGESLIEALKHLYPKMRIAYFTGRADPIIHHPDLPVIHKPFVIDTLLEEVKRILKAEG